MSRTSEESKAAGGGGGGSAHTVGPRLREATSLGYAEWKPQMEIHLQRIGAQGVHRRLLSRQDWEEDNQRVERWEEDKLEAARALLRGGAGTGNAETDSSSKKKKETSAVSSNEEQTRVSGSSPSSGTETDSASKQKLSSDEEKARAVVKSLVERSSSAFGVIYSALPDQLRTQVDAHVLPGHAYGIWSWLETKYQSTEEDSVGEKLEEWATLHQEENEAYDAYRARVDKLREHLVAAKEPPSHRMYALMMVGRLQPRYGQVVLALKASNMLKDAEKIDWSQVNAMINRHEREETRMNADVDGTMASALAARYRGSSGSESMARGGRSQSSLGTHGASAGSGKKRPASQEEKSDRDATMECYECHKVGHRKRECPVWLAKRKARESDESKPSSSGDKPRRRNKESAAAAQSAKGVHFKSDGQENSSSEDDGFEPSGGRRRGKAHLAKAVRLRSISYRSINPHDAVLPEGEDIDDDPAQSEPRVVEANMRTQSVKRDGAAGTKAPDRKEIRRSSKSLGASPAQEQGLRDESLGIDTMASTHISGNRSLFRTLRECEPIGIEVADGTVIVANRCGTICITVEVDGGRTVKIPIHGVYYHPSFAANLLSWGMLREDGWSMKSSPEESYVQMPGGARLSLSTEGRVSVLHSVSALGKSSMPEDHGARRVYQLGSHPKLTTPNVAALIRLHEKLGHMSFARMIQVMKGGFTVDVKKIQASEHELREAEERVRECYACAAGRGHRQPFGRRGLDKGNSPCETLHMDTFFVRMKQDGRQWLEYGTVIKDPYTSTKWMFYSKTKDVIPSKMRKAIIEIERQYDCKVKRVYTDGGTEFINSELKKFYSERGIVMHHSPAGTPQLNGVAERAVGIVKNATRALLAHGNVPEEFWPNACHHAVYLWNRTHVASRTGKTPYESLYKKKPSVKSLGVFGCDVFYEVPRDQRSVWQPKLAPGVYLGHSSVQNCAAVYSFAKRKIIFTRDVVYRSGSFEFCGALRAGEVAVERLLDNLAALNRQGRLHSKVGLPSSDRQGGHEVDRDSYWDGSDAGHLREEAESADEEDATPADKGSVSSSSASDAKDEEDEEEEERFSIDKILKQRKKNGALEYEVKWGDGTLTWEPSEGIQEDAPRVVEAFQRRLKRGVGHPADPAAAAADADDSVGVPASKPAPRRSPRNHQQESTEAVEQDPDDEPRVQSAMSAVRALLPLYTKGAAVTPTPVVDEKVIDAIACAVRAGIAQLESRTPRTYNAARKSADWPKWKAAMDAELKSCFHKKVWEEVDRSRVPRDSKVLPLKWVYKIKTDSSNGKESELFKARITAMGNFQEAGKDYGEVYARTAAYKTLRLQLSMSAKYGHRLYQMDVPTAFLNAELDEEVYVQVPPGYTDGKEEKVMKLRKSLYGLRQSPRNWWKQMDGFITLKLGFKATVSDPCLFFKRSKTGRLMLIYLFVDDIQASIHPEDESEWKKYEALLVSEFNTKLLGESSSMLGMRITRDWKAGTITLDQELYITKALEKYGMSECKTAATPEVVGAAHQSVTEANSKPCDRQQYMEIVGTLMYAAVSTRPDIAHAVFYLASNMMAPTEQHRGAADRVLRYLAGTRSLGLVFGSRNGGVLGDSRGYVQQQVDVCAFADADWANAKKDRRSITGWVAKLNGDPVSWASKRQRVVALSTCEAELYAGAAAIQEVMWLRGLLQELGLHTRVGSVVHGDNQSSLAVAQHGVRSERTKHIDVKYHFVTETVERGDVRLKWVQTADQEADIFTKALPLPAFTKLRDCLMAPMKQSPQ